MNNFTPLFPPLKKMEPKEQYIFYWGFVICFGSTFFKGGNKG
jgi:hypothetical protein